MDAIFSSSLSRRFQACVCDSLTELVRSRLIFLRAKEIGASGRFEVCHIGIKYLTILRRKARTPDAGSDSPFYKIVVHMGIKHSTRMPRKARTPGVGADSPFVKLVVHTGIKQFTRMRRKARTSDAGSDSPFVTLAVIVALVFHLYLGPRDGACDSERFGAMSTLRCELNICPS